MQQSVDFFNLVAATLLCLSTFATLNRVVKKEI